MFLSQTLNEYPGAKEVCEFIEYYNKHLHELCVCNGTQRTYNYCRGIVKFENDVFHNGEHYLNQNDVYTYENAKCYIRRAIRRIKQVKNGKR